MDMALIRIRRLEIAKEDVFANEAAFSTYKDE
jgi:hypothetical protein